MNKAIESFLNYYNQLDARSVFNFMFFNHAFLIVHLVYTQLYAQEKKRPPLLIGLFSTIVMGLGGSIISNFVLGKPQIFFDDDIFLFSFIVAWCLYAYVPGISFLVLAFSLPMCIIQGMFVSQFIIGGIKNAVEVYPTSVFAPIFFGTIGGCGGALLFPLISWAYGGFKNLTFTELSKPSITIKVPFLLSVFYYTSVYIYKVKPYNISILISGEQIQINVNPAFVVGVGCVLLFIYHWIVTVLSTLLSSSRKEEKKELQKKKKKIETKKNK